MNTQTIMNKELKNSAIEYFFLFLMWLVGFGMGQVAVWMKLGAI